MLHFPLRRILAVAAVLGLVLVIAQSADAQRRGRGGMQIGNVSVTQLAYLPDVQKELKLTDAQSAKVNSVYEDLAIGRGQVMSTIPKEGGQRGPKLAKLNEKATADVKAALDESQWQRLQQLLLQVNGAVELYKPELQTALHITDEQKERLAKIRRTTTEARRAIRQGSGDRWSAMTELKEKTDAELLNVLTPDQQKQFKQMQGEKADIDLFGN